MRIGSANLVVANRWRRHRRVANTIRHGFDRIARACEQISQYRSVDVYRGAPTLLAFGRSIRAVGRSVPKSLRLISAAL
jgi:hypothetical protein